MQTEFIKTENYLLLVDINHQVKQADLVVFPKTKDDIANPKNIGTVEFIMDTTVTVSISDFTITIPKFGRYKPLKILAHLPLNNTPILEGVDLLPNPFEEAQKSFDVCDIHYADYCREHPTERVIYNHFKAGYDASQQVKQFSLEDMYRVAIKVANRVARPEYGERININEIVDNYIQSLSTQQLPVGFEPKFDRIRLPKGDDGWEDVYQLRIVTDSLGQKVVQGEYKFK